MQISLSHGINIFREPSKNFYGFGFFIGTTQNYLGHKDFKRGFAISLIRYSVDPPACESWMWWPFGNPYHGPNPNYQTVQLHLL